MTAVSFVDDAKGRAAWLVDRESRGPGDLRNAMERVARRHGIPFAQLWALRYREPKDLPVTVYFTILIAYETAREEQARAFHDEHKATVATTALGRLLVRAAAALGSAQGQALNAPEEI